MAEKTKAQPKPKYTATIQIMGVKYKATGKTATEAIAKLDNKRAKGVGLLSVSLGKESRERILTGNQVMRLFSPAPLTREVALKNIQLLFDL
jgi:hypothetical protein